MKRIGICFALFALVFSSCEKAAVNPVVDEDDGSSVYFELIPGTRSGSQPSDASLGSVEVLMFDAVSGGLSARGTATNVGSTGYVKVSNVNLNREYVCRVVANVRNASGEVVSFANASSVNDIDNYELSLATYGSDRVPMFGKVTKTFTSSDKNASVTLYRAASRIKVEKITGAFEPDWLKTANANVTAVYVYKAPGNYRLGLEIPSNYSYTLYHKSGYSSSDVSALGSFAPYVGETISSGNSIKGNAVFSSPRWFLCCPRASFTPSDPKDLTYITIEVTINGTKYYYGVPMTDPTRNPNGLRANYQYIIQDVRITDLGASEPPGIVTKDAVQFDVTIQDWQIDPGFDGSISF